MCSLVLVSNAVSCGNALLILSNTLTVLMIWLQRLSAQRPAIATVTFECVVRCAIKTVETDLRKSQADLKKRIEPFRDNVLKLVEARSFLRCQHRLLILRVHLRKLSSTWLAPPQ